MRARVIIFAAAAFLLGLLPGQVRALTARGQLEDIEYRAYGPSWIWQRNDVNVLLVLRHPGQGFQAVTLQLELGEGADAAFSAPPNPLQIVTIGPGEEKRAAFVGIKTSGEGRPGTYRMNLTLHAGNRIVSVPYPVEVVRGPAIGSGLFPVYCPLGVALAWCGLIALIIPRFARPGAWKKPSAPFASQAGKNGR